jgi:hypothetical protein
MSNTILPVKAKSDSKKTGKMRKNLWFERFMAIAALANFGLVMFDLSYIPLRDFYLQYAPNLTWWYGEQFKGIEPHRVTAAYLEVVDEIEQQLEQTGAAGLQQPQTQAILEDLRQRSVEIIDEDPFQVADKSGTLERIKNRMRDRLDDDSAREAFSRFWTEDYLQEQGWRQEMAFFNEDIRPLIETNYFRGIGFDGNPINDFWKIDIWFFALFGTEFLARTLYLSLRYKGTNWFDAMLWRWYDVLLLLPFWRWLRIIPVTVRLNHSKLINLLPIQSRIIREFIASIAIELTEIVVIRIIDQAQNLIRQGEVSQMLLKPSGRRYIDINGIDEIEAISNHLITTLVYQVIPKLKPEIEEILSNNIGNTLQASPVYQGIQSIPGLQDWPDHLTRQLTSEITKTTYDALTHALQDSAGNELNQKLIQKLVTTFREEIQRDNTVEELEYLLTVMLEEVKINYVKRLPEEDIEELEEQAYKIYEMTQMGRKG